MSDDPVQRHIDRFKKLDADTGLNSAAAPQPEPKAPEPEPDVGDVFRANLYTLERCGSRYLTNPLFLLILFMCVVELVSFFWMVGDFAIVYLGRATNWTTYGIMLRENLQSTFAFKLLPFTSFWEARDFNSWLLEGIKARPICVYEFRDQFGLFGDSYLRKDCEVPIALMNDKVNSYIAQNFNFIGAFGHIFLHANPLHLAINMWVLLLIGPYTYLRLGAVRFFSLFFVAGFLGAVTFWGVHIAAVAGWSPFAVRDPGMPMVGASGAIFGILGFYIALYDAQNKRRENLRGEKRVWAYRKRILFGVIGYNVVFAIINFPIAWEAHLGGLLVGIIAAQFIQLPAKNLRQNLRRFAPAPPVASPET